MTMAIYYIYWYMEENNKAYPIYIDSASATYASHATFGALKQPWATYWL